MYDSGILLCHWLDSQAMFILIGSSAYDNIKDIQFSAKLMSQKCLKYFKTFRIYIMVIFS